MLAASTNNKKIYNDVFSLVFTKLFPEPMKTISEKVINGILTLILKETNGIKNIKDMSDLLGLSNVLVQNLCHLAFGTATNANVAFREMFKRSLGKNNFMSSLYGVLQQRPGAISLLCSILGMDKSSAKITESLFKICKKD